MLPLADGYWQVLDKGELLSFSEKNKPCFINETTGESVVEFTGMATDQRADRSWAKATFRENGSSPCHYHNEREEFYYITAGVAKVIIDGVEYILLPSEFVKILSKQRHQVFSLGKEPLKMMVKCAPAWVFEDQLPEN